MSFNEKLSYTEHVVTTPATDFSIGFKDYGDNSDTIKVTVDDVLATDAGYTVFRKNAMTIALEPAVTSGVVRLQRETNIDSSFYRFTAGAKFVAANMDANFEQILHSQQETRDGFTKLASDVYPLVNGLEEALAQADSASQAAQEAAEAAEEAAQITRSANQVIDSSGKTQQDINDAKSISYLLNVQLYDGLMINTTSYHSDLNIGGNIYKYVPSISRSSHNGGTIIDPTKTFPSDWGDKAQQQVWFTATSSLMGVFVLVKPDTDICASDFGAHPNKDSSYAIQAAVNYSAYRTVIYADVVLNSSETLQIKNGCGLRGDHYTHNSRSTLKSSILNYSGTGDAIRFGEFSDTAARNITLKDVHLFDVLGTARCATIAYDLIGSDVDFVATGFEVSLVVQHYLYYINRCKVFGYNYRKNGILIGGNINEGAVEFKLISTSLEIDTGFSCGQTSAAYGVVSSSSNNPTISGSVEQHSGRHFSFSQIRGGAIKPYFESPAVDGSAYQTIQMTINRCYGSEFIVYGSGKSGYSVYVDNSRDCKISGEIKGGVTADLSITSTCFGIDTSGLHASKIIATHYSTGSIVGRASNGGAVRESYGAATATPTAGCYGVGSKLWYTNPTTLTPITVVTDVTLNTGVTPNTITKTTKTINQKEIGKLVTVAGSFGTLAATTVTGLVGESVLIVNSGANNILVGDYLSIPTNGGSYRIDYIYQDGVNTMIRVNRALTASVNAVTVSYFAPTTEAIITTA